NELDLLIMDSEGMGSIAAKYISRRTEFDKKMTLLGLMCSQILIINTKGLTRDISDILEVSSYHLGALSTRESKPRISFVIRDMKDSKKAQHTAFCGIYESLKKMFEEIPDSSYDMDDFMIVEEKDVHLLENAFTCFFDDFCPKSFKDHYGTTIISYKKAGLKLIEERASKGKWDEKDDEYIEIELTREKEKYYNETIASFKEKISDQFDPQIIDEGE
ncbi:17363_t:CDS:2, partial [Acaulospora colombiana]